MLPVVALEQVLLEPEQRRRLNCGSGISRLRTFRMFKTRLTSPCARTLLGHSMKSSSAVKLCDFAEFLREAQRKIMENEETSC